MLVKETMDFSTVFLLLCLAMNVNGQAVRVDELGKDIILTCPNTYRQPYCQWQRKSSPNHFYDITTDRKYKKQNTIRMTIQQFSYLDGGSYRCKCYNSGQSNIKRYSIIIDTADINTEHQLDCGLGGSRFRWKRFRSNQHIIRDDQTFSNSSSKVLLISGVHNSQSGIYSCRCYASTCHWVDFYLVVQDYKKPMVNIPWPKYAAAIGYDLLLECIVGKTFPQTTQIWWSKLHNGHNVNVSGSDVKKYQGGTIERPSLLIFNISSSDSGEYRCYGHNINGNTRVATQIMTGYKPLFPETEIYTFFVQQGSKLTLNCTPRASKTKLTAIYWEWKKTGKFKNINYGTRRYIGGNLSLQNLTIIHVDPYDEGEYRCNVANYFGTSFVDMEVKIERPIDVSVSKKTYYPVRGKMAKLDCDFSNAVQFWWKRVNEGKESPLDSSKISGELTKSLTIQSVQEQDDGKYRCYGSNNFDRKYGTITVLSGYPPHVTMSQDNYITRLGVNVTIRGVVMNGRPGSTLTWRRWKSYTYNTAGNLIGDGDISNPFLTIRNVKHGDAGNYTLCVNNSYGYDCDFTVLKVISATITGTRKLSKKANDSITIKCEVTGGGRVIWRRNGKQLEIINQKSVHIDQLNRSHKGNYTCETSVNTLTAKSAILQLDVEDIPLVTTTSKNVEVNKGDDIVLPCSHDSNPTPTHVYWTKNGINISAYRSTKYNGSTIDSPSLVIHDTGTSDSGTYVCSVSNKLGIGYSKPLQLLIRAKQTSQAGTVAGILVAIVIVVGVVVVVVAGIILRRRKQKSGTTKRSTAKVSMHRERGDSAIGLHFNSRPMSSVAADEGKVSIEPVVAADTEYYNVSDVTSTCIRMEDLKTYIQKRRRHEELKKEYKSIPNIAEHPTSHAQTKDNMPKNRFKTTFPYDHTRVILKSDGGSDYINANYIDGFEKERCYIASQGPVKNTVADHWKMIWQENIHKIVMVTNLVEGIKTKCEQYWPCGGKQMVHGNLIIRLNAEKERTAYVTREISIEDKKSGKTRNVTQYHFTAWPDHGTPDPLYLVLFHRHVISDPKAGHSGPLLVHCSAGIGRTGTYIALDALLEEGRTTGFLDIFKFLKKMRYSRMNMIQTSNQYVFLHYALLEAFTMKDTKIRKDEFSEVWQSIRTDHKALNHQRLNKEFKELEQHVGETKGLSPSMLNATKDDQNHNQYNAAMSTTNLAKNRNKDVLPMDDKRVYLVSYGKGRSDYINAVQVPSYTKFVGYITTQLPLPDTKVDFWTMIRDHSSSTIVLIINKENEADLVYSQSGDDLTIGPFGIKISARKKGENDITKITMVLSRKDDKPRQVVLFQAICNSIPDPAVLGKLADLISTRATMSNDPITVVSSDGAKNCGLFCVFTNAVSSMQIDNNADIFQLVRLLQLRRPEFFTDFEEYKRCYEALQVHLESANVYANF